MGQGPRRVGLYSASQYIRPKTVEKPAPRNSCEVRLRQRGWQNRPRNTSITASSGSKGREERPAFQEACKGPLAAGKLRPWSPPGRSTRIGRSLQQSGGVSWRELKQQETVRPCTCNQQNGRFIDGPPGKSPCCPMCGVFRRVSSAPSSSSAVNGRPRHRAPAATGVRSLADPKIGRPGPRANGYRHHLGQPGNGINKCAKAGLCGV